MSPRKAEDLWAAVSGQAGTDEAVATLLAPYAFSDCRSAARCLRRMFAAEPAQAEAARFLPGFLRAIAESADPDRSLLNFEHFSTALESSADLILLLDEDRRLLELLAILFSGSQFLTDILLRNPGHIERLKDPKYLLLVKSRQRFGSEARDAIQDKETIEGKLSALWSYQHHELLRIGSGDLLAALDLQAVTSQLTNLARALIQICLELAAHRNRLKLDGFTVLAVGKLGGRELNYSSDIDLLFLAREQSQDAQKLGRDLIRLLTRTTPEGFLYRVDMRLRPWGKVGTLTPSIDEHLIYLRNRAQVWEKQAMYRARVVAGDGVLGIEFLQRIRPYILDLPAEKLREEIRRMKANIETKLNRRGKGWGEVKSGAGSIRDVEFVTQFLQLVNGKNRPEVHSRNTLDGLARLAACKILSAEDYRTAADGYIFLRSVEHHLQIMHYRQTHQLPESPGALNYLARRLGFQGKRAGEQFVRRYDQHRKALRRLYESYLGSREALPHPAPARTTGETPSPQELVPHISRLDAAYVATFEPNEISRHARLVATLTPENPVALHVQTAEPGEWQVTIIGYDYLGALSLICGLFFDYDINILQGAVFTYEKSTPGTSAPRRAHALRQRGRRTVLGSDTGGKAKIIDVFRVSSARTTLTPQVWEKYQEELSRFVTGLRDRRSHDVLGEIARRGALKVSEIEQVKETLLPVDIAIDNTLSKRCTVLRIDAADTIGFLYELTNALSLNGIQIVRVMVSSVGSRVHDTLFLTNVQGQKITDARELYQLRVATLLVKQFTHLLPQSPNPESAMMHFRELVSHLFAQPEWAEAMVSLERPEVLDALARLLGVSDFLWHDFLRMQHENLFPVVENLDALRQARSRAQLEEGLNTALAQTRGWSDGKRCLNEFKDREMFRIDMRYIQGVLSEFQAFSRELTDLAEVVVERAVHLAFATLSSEYGQPCLETGQPCPWCVVGLGKLGGRELGFASDIELMFLYQEEGMSAGPTRIQASLFFERLVKQVSAAIVSRDKGIFEIDLRLRPYGKGGNLAVSLDSFRKYYAPGGPAWDYERQALVRLRPLCGDEKFASEVETLRDTYVFTGISPDMSAMRAMRQRQLRQLVAGGALNAKFSSGGLVDLEYLVQHLQIVHGAGHPELRLPGTSEALAALGRAGIIAGDDLSRLQEAYQFLRKLIEALRMVRGNAKDLNVPAEDSKEFAFLMRRMGNGGSPGVLKEQLHQYMAFVDELRNRLLGQ